MPYRFCRLSLPILFLFTAICWGQAAAPGGDAGPPNVAQGDYPPLPKAPAGWDLREVARLPERATRLASDGTGTFLYVLMLNGDVMRLDIATGKFSDVFKATDYSGGGSALGLMLDQTNRLYIVLNTADGAARPMMAHVTIYRTTTVKNGLPADAKPWVQAQYPFGIDVFNHGVSYIAAGPDGMIYVSSGSRTDHGEKGNDPTRSTAGEDPLTGCIWRIDPNVPDPKIEIYARGLRNAFTFCWGYGGLFSSENGPNADAPEEMNYIEQGKHYGFPYVFSDYKQKVYPDQPDAPPGLTFEPPIMNIGPDGGGSPDKPLGTFDAHSSPSGMVYLNEGKDVPPANRGTFLVSRFGCFLGAKDVGFDIVQVKIETESPRWTISTHEFLSPLGRPIDLHLSGGKVFICEYSRETRRGNGADLPGRILELSPNP